MTQDEQDDVELKQAQEELARLWRDHGIASTEAHLRLTAACDQELKVRELTIRRDIRRRIEEGVEAMRRQEAAP